MESPAALPSMPMLNLSRMTDRNLRIVRARELLTIPSPDWLVEGVLEQSSFNVLYGAPGTGKSFIALDLALSLAYGRPWNGINVAGGSVIYVAAEGYQSLARRLQAWMSYYQLPLPDHIGFVIEPIDMTGGVKTLEQFMTDCVGEMQGGLMQYEEDEGELVPSGLITESPPVQLVIFDTLARCIPGADENDAKDMGRVVQWLDCLRDADATGVSPAIMLIHHSSKRGEAERGSTALRGAADTMLYVKNDGAGPVLRCTKQKNAEAFKDMSMTIKAIDAQSALVVPRGAPAKVTKGPELVDDAADLPKALSMRQIDTLRAVALCGLPEGIRLTDICTLTDLSPATAYRMRVSLELLNYLHFDERSKRSLVTLEGLERLVRDGVISASLLPSSA